MIKKINIKVAVLLMGGAMLTTSCVGSFSLFNKLAQWNRKATDNKFLNELIFLIISPAYGVCTLVDAVVLNSIEFWTGNNPLASNIGKTQKIMGQDGRYYAVKTLKEGYEVTNPEGEIIRFIYNKENNSWSQIQNGKTKEVFRFNADGTIQANINGNKMDVTLDEAGVYQVKMAINEGSYWAMR